MLKDLFFISTTSNVTKVWLVLCAIMTMMLIAVLSMLLLFVISSLIAKLISKPSKLRITRGLYPTYIHIYWFVKGYSLTKDGNIVKRGRRLWFKR